MSTVSCDCSADVDGRDRCSSQTIRTARKPYECLECGESIHVGKKYEESTGIDYEGNPYRYRTCIGCANLRKKYCPYGWFWGGLADQLMDCLGFDYRTTPAEIECDDDDGSSLYPTASETTNAADP